MKTDFVFDPQAPLLRMSGETRKANDALWDYWHMGSGRSFRKLIGQYRGEHGLKSPRKTEPPTIHLTTLDSWSVRWQWQARISRAKEIQDEEDERMYQSARRAVRLGAIEDYDSLRDLANQILERGPDFLKTSTRHVQGKWEKIEGKDGKTYHVQLTPDREIVTVALDGRLAIQALKEGTRMAREAVGIEANGVPLVQVNQNLLMQTNIVQARLESLPEGRRNDLVALFLRAERVMAIEGSNQTIIE